MSDQSLAEYVGGLLRQGYTEEQVRASLRQHGYPQSLVDATFRALGQTGNGPAPSARQPPSAANQIAAYLRTYLNQGYRVEQLRPYLLSQGYAAADVDAAIGAATGQPVIRHEVHMPGATVAKLALLLLIAAGLVFGILYFRGAFAGNESPAPVPSGGSTPARLLDVRISLDRTTVAPGGTVNAQIEATNMGAGNGRYDVAFSYQLVDDAGTPVVAATTTRAITTSISFSQPVTVPADAPEGRYAVEVSADYGGSSPAVASQQLTVQQAAQPSQSANQSADETPQRPMTPPIIIVTDQSDPTDEATAAAKAGDSAKAEGICAGIKNQAKHDQCLTLISMTDGQASHCAAIIGDDERDSCYFSIIMNGHYEYCSKLVSPDKRQLCANMEHIGSLGNATQPATQPSIGSFAS